MQAVGDAIVVVVGLVVSLLLLVVWVHTYTHSQSMKSQLLVDHVCSNTLQRYVRLYHQSWFLIKHSYNHELTIRDYYLIRINHYPLLTIIDHN